MSEEEFHKEFNWLFQCLGLKRITTILNISSSTVYRWANGESAPAEHGRVHTITMLQNFRQ